MTAADDANLDELKRRARRRLVGAIVLALVVAVVVPMLLESDPKPLGEDVAVKIPPVDDGKFVNRLSDKDKTKAEPPKASPKAEARPEPKAEPKVEPPRVEPPKAEAETVARPAAANAEPAADAAESKADTGAAGKSEAAKAEPAAPASAAKSEPPKETAKAAPAGAAPQTAAPAKTASAATAGIPAASPTGLFAVQVYAFSDAYGANSLVGKLKRAGYPAYSESTTTSSQATLWRVRIGPYGSREVAATARDKLKGEGYNGIVTTK